MICQNFLNKHCLSCDLLSQEYSWTIKSKKQALALLFPNHIAQIKPSVICENGGGSTRNKAKLAVALIQNEIEFGFYDNDMRFKKLEDCPLHAPTINSVLIVLKKLLKEYKIIPYDLKSKKGELKYVLMTYSESSNQVLLRFILRSTESISRLKKMMTSLISLHPYIKVVTANIQPTHQAILEGEEEIVLTEKDYITHHFDQYVLFQGPRSFFQTNTEIALKLYKQFQHDLAELNIHSILDLYCGVGAFSFFSSKYCSKVTGVEISDAAISYANKARENNQCNDINFVAMDVEVFLKAQSEKYDGVIVNPPRRGLNEIIIHSLLQLAPKYIFYSSCNAETLQRDLKALEKTYAIQSLRIFDMFPFTKHFEVLAVLSKI